MLQAAAADNFATMTRTIIYYFDDDFVALMNRWLGSRHRRLDDR